MHIASNANIIIRGLSMDFDINKEELKVDYSKYGNIENQQSALNSIEDLGKDELNTLKSVGANFVEESEFGKFLMYGVDVFILLPKIEGVEIMPLKIALQVYPEIKDKYYFNAIKKEHDEFTKIASEKEQNGFFIRVKENVKVKSLNAALFMHKEMSTMCIHNIVIVEEGAELHLITGCTCGCTIAGGLHISISEYYVEKNAKFIDTMVHNWGNKFIVRPRTATIVDENGTFVSNYYSHKPPKQIEINPFTHLKGKNATAKYMSAILCLPETYSDIGGTVLMTGEKSGAELVVRAVNHGGTVIQTGLLIGAAKDSRAHIDCSGLMLD